MLTNFAAKVQQRSWVNCVCTHTCRFLDTYDRSFWVLLGDLQLLFSCELILLFVPRSWICFTQLATLAITLSRRHVSRSMRWTCIVLHFFVYRHTSSQCLGFCQLSQPSCSFSLFLNFPICVLAFPPLLFVQPVLLHSWNMFPKLAYCSGLLSTTIQLFTASVLLFATYSFSQRTIPFFSRLTPLLWFIRLLCLTSVHCLENVRALFSKCFFSSSWFLSPSPGLQSSWAGLLFQ